MITAIVIVILSIVATIVALAALVVGGRNEIR